MEIAKEQKTVGKILGVGREYSDFEDDDPAELNKEEYINENAVDPDLATKGDTEKRDKRLALNYIL